MTTNIAEHAAAIAKKGGEVFPCKPTGDSAKAPLIANGFKAATTDPEQIRKWWSDWPTALIGLVVPEHLLVLDIDPRNGGSLDALEQVTGKLPATVTTWSGRGDGGRHLWFLAPNRTISARRLPAGVDLKTGGKGYVIAPPSLHPATGEPYQWEHREYVALPSRAVEALQPSKPVPAPAGGRGSGDGIVRTVAEAVEGERNSSLYWAACRAFDDDNENIVQELFDAAIGVGLPEQEAAATIDSARSTERTPRTVATMTRPESYSPELNADASTLPSQLNPAEGEQHRGQARIAYRLAALYAHKLMFVRGLGWHVWDGKRWAADEKDAATGAVLDVLRDALSESLDDSELRRDVRKCETANGIAGVLSIASALPTLRAGTDELDADPYLFNVANGTMDLRTRELRPHDPADRMTRVTAGAYDPDAEQGSWAAFLESVLPDASERDYLKRVIGQSVFGAVREHLFPVLTGTGANGKGTTYGAIAHALGDYATIIDPSLLMTRDRGPGGPEMMQLFGARLVIGSETEEGKSLDASLMKRLTGGDQITARNLYQPPVSWDPSHQMIYVTNHLPKVKGNDPAVWRRIRVIPFDVVVPEDQRDPELPERLTLAADAVLTWAVQGWFDYEDTGGMNEPDSVQQATDRYQTDSDAVKRFTTEHCVTGPHFHARGRELFAAWSTWAVSDGADPMSEKRFTTELERLGYHGEKTRVGKIWQGIGLPAETEE